MNPNNFLKACWKDNIERDYSESSLETTFPQGIRTIRELTEITAPPEVVLLMVMATIYKGVCAKILHRELVKCLNESDPDRTDRARVIMVRAICDLPVAPLTKMLVIITLVSPGALKRFKDKCRESTDEEMTPLSDRMTPPPGPSKAQPLVTAG
jgi:hypothetical protein